MRKKSKHNIPQKTMKLQRKRERKDQRRAAKTARKQEHMAINIQLSMITLQGQVCQSKDRVAEWTSKTNPADMLPTEDSFQKDKQT